MSLECFIRLKKYFPNLETIVSTDKQDQHTDATWMQRYIKTIGNRPIGAGGAAATPDKENNLSTRNQMLMKKQFHIGNQFMMPTSLCFM